MNKISDTRYEGMSAEEAAYQRVLDEEQSQYRARKAAEEKAARELIVQLLADCGLGIAADDVPQTALTRLKGYELAAWRNGYELRSRV